LATGVHFIKLLNRIIRNALFSSSWTLIMLRRSSEQHIRAAVRDVIVNR